MPASSLSAGEKATLSTLGSWKPLARKRNDRLLVQSNPSLAHLDTVRSTGPVVLRDSTFFSRNGFAKQAAATTFRRAPGSIGEWSIGQSGIGQSGCMVVGDMPLACPGAGTNGQIMVRCYRPAGLTASAACVVYLHGGGFIKGSLDSGDPIAWGIADQAHAVVFGVEYRLAPDHPFPAGVEDCYAVLKHLAAYGAALGIDPARLAVRGDSAGGNMAAAVCLMARDRGGPAIAAQVLIYACLTDDISADSYVRYAEAPVTTDSVDRCWDLYLGEGRPTRNAYAAPLKAETLSGLLPAHIHYGEFDCLADDSRQYAARLKQAGNDVTLRCAERMIHGFVRARFSGPDAAREYDIPCGFLRRHLHTA
jgi:acetyl esterase